MTAVTAVALGLIEGGVSRRQHRGGVAAVFRPAGDAEADGHRNTRFAGVGRHLPADALGNFERRVDPGPGQQDGELVAALAKGAIGTADGDPHYLANLAKVLITGGVAVVIVDLFQ